MKIGAIGQRIYQLPGREPQRIDLNAEGRAIYRIIAEQLQEARPDRLITTGVIGFDLLVAYVAKEIDITYDLYLPYENIDRWWTPVDQQYFAEVRAGASRIIQVSRGKSSAKKIQRCVRRIVDEVDCVYLFWDERRKTGRTVEAMHYAWVRRTNTDNLFAQFRRTSS